MVSLRCKMIVKAELVKLGLHYGAVDLGEAEVKEDISTEQLEKLKAGLLHAGLELMDDKRAMLVEKVKNVIIEMIHYADDLPKVKNSTFISDKVHHDYGYLANLFTEVTGTTIEQYIIAHKIERAKELILYNELTLTQIAYQLDYSSAGHLSNQFKKVTGLTPSYFRKLKRKKLINLENVGMM